MKNPSYRAARALPEMNSAQREAATASLETPLLIVAGAGTGKTRTLTNRLTYLLLQGIPSGSICALTFTNKAAREMEERVATARSKWHMTRSEDRGANNKDQPMPFIGTFHSLGARLLRKECRSFGRTHGFTIFDENDSRSIIRRIAQKLGEKHGPAKLQRFFSNIKNGQSEKGDRASALFSQVQREAHEAFDYYEDRLRANNAFDFDDLIQKPVLLFKKNPEVLRRYQPQFRHILVDEYQDINSLQYEFIKLLAGTEGIVTVVGDDQQLIYGWRGSDIETFLQFESHWPRARVVLLEQNYRSTKTIIRAASELVGNNTFQKEKMLWTENDAGSRIRVFAARHEEDEADWIAENIAGGEWRMENGERQVENKKLREGQSTKTVSRGSDKQFPSSHTPYAVLYRTNAQSRALEHALLARDIPYHIFGGITFYERREIKDILAGLRALFNPRDEVSKERLQKAFTKGFFEAFRQMEGNVLAEKGPALIIREFVERTAYTNYLEKYFLNADERKENIAELIRFAEEFNDVSEFLERVTLLQATDRLGATSEDAKPLVSLMTIHLAKGLEFDRVYIAGCSEGLMPHAKSMYPQKELEEERRLMYVAMTRARKELAISFYDVPSRFLLEIPEEYLDVAGDIPLNDEERYIEV